MKSQDQTHKPSVSKNFFLSSVFFAFALGIFIGSGFIVMTTPVQTDKITTNDRDENFKFIRTAMTVKDGEERRPNTELAPFHYKIKEFIDGKINRNDARMAAVYVSRARIDKVFKDLNVEYDPHNDNDSLSLRAFASFYRVLFNASYLNEEMSEKALRYLVKSSQKHGMASGIPLNIDIAGKFGERNIKTSENGTETELTQMHEFAIIYHPRRPFIIGIVVRGEDASTLTKMIQEITRLVYEEVDQQS